MNILIQNSVKSEQAKIGMPAPDFTLFNERGEGWRLSKQLGRVTALLFYPKSETLVCTKQMCSLRDHWSDYIETKAVIVGISPGTADEHVGFAEHHRLPLPLLADPDRRITKIYSSHWLLPVSFTRAIVVVDAKGIIRFRRVMLRAFRPTDFQVLTAIYEAKTESVIESHQLLSKSHQDRN